MKWLQRLRGAIGMGVTWAIACSAVGAIPRWVFGVNTDVPIPLVFGAFGFVAGVTFSGILVLTEGRRSFEEMSLPRFAGWGAAGGLLLSGAWAATVSLGLGAVLAVAASFALASAACATGSLALARRGGSRELPEVEDAAEQRKLR